MISVFVLLSMVYTSKSQIVDVTILNSLQNCLEAYNKLEHKESARCFERTIQK